MAFESRDPFLIRQVNLTWLVFLDIAWFHGGTSLSLWNDNSLTAIRCLSRNVKTQLWQIGTALHIGSILGFQWKKMVKMSLMEVQKFGMSHLKLLFECNEVSFS
jgi:hypothetical protein